jgi:hypothetical protein
VSNRLSSEAHLQAAVLPRRCVPPGVFDRLCSPDRTLTFHWCLFRQLRSFAIPFLRRKPYIRLQLLQEPIPRAGVAINVQPLRLWPVSRLPVRRRKSLAQFVLG